MPPRGRVDKRDGGGGQLGDGCAAEVGLAGGGGELAAHRAGWEMLPPRDRAQKRSSVEDIQINVEIQFQDLKLPLCESTDDS